MKVFKYIFTALVAVAFFTSCETTKTQGLRSHVYANLYSEKPLAVAIAPPINKTNNVEAKEFFYCTLAQPLSERGYYVFPTLLTMEMFKSESAYDAELYISGSAKKFEEILGADAVLYTTITKWEKAALMGNIKVEVEYMMKSTKTDQELFYRKGTLVYDASTNASGGGLFGALVDMAVTAINTATTDHVKVARSCNSYTIIDLPAGTYHPSHGSDQHLKAGLREFSQTVK